MDRKPQSVARLLQTRSDLAELLRQTGQRRELLQQVRRALPEELAPHCVAATLERGSLRLRADSPVWAARLRYQVPQLLARLRADRPGLANIQVKAGPAADGGIARSRQDAPAAPRAPSPAAASAVEAAARQVTDPSLCHALQRLARTLRGGD